MIDTKVAVTPGLATTPPRTSRLAGFIFYGLCAVIVFAPLPLASARPLAWDSLALAVALLLTAALFLPAQATSIVRERLIIPAVLFAMVIAMGLLQIIPWLPASLRSPIWDQAADALASSTHASIAIDRYAAWTHVLRLLSYVGIFYIAVVTGRDARRARFAVGVVALSGWLYAVYGLLVYWSGNRTVLWLPKWAYLQDLTGPFVNRNSFATYLGICTLASLALVLESFARINLQGDVRRKLIMAIEFFSAKVLGLIMFFILITSLLLTHSRGGLIASVMGALALFLAVAFAPGMGRLRRVSRWAMVPLFLVFAIGLLASGGTTLDRFVTDIDSNTRLVANQLIIQAIKDYPFLGIGLGSFASVFPIYKTAAITGYFDLAHNDYLENLLELGIPAALCLFAAIAWCVVLCVRGIFTRRQDAIFPCLGLAVSILVGLHATVDFSLQIPAVTDVYLFLLGIAVAQSVSSREAAPKTSAGR